jgi:hypothetical protein
MNTAETREPTGMEIKGRLSTLWIVVMLNVVFADILTFITPGALSEIMTGTPGGIQVSQGLLLVFAVLLEIPIAMIFLSRTLKYTVNRWANIIACVVTIAFVIGGGSAYLHYYFFAAIEVACMAGIAWSAWKWPNPDAPEGAGADSPARSQPERSAARSPSPI